MNTQVKLTAPEQMILDKELIIAGFNNRHIYKVGELRIDIKAEVLSINDQTFSDQIVGLMKAFYNQRYTTVIKNYVIRSGLTVVADVYLKFTPAKNVMANVITRTSEFSALYGDPNLEQIVPEPKTNNIASLTCFKGFSEFSDYVGIPVQAFADRTSFDLYLPLGLLGEKTAVDIFITEQQEQQLELFRSFVDEKNTNLLSTGLLTPDRTPVTKVEGGFKYNCAFADYLTSKYLEGFEKFLGITAEELFSIKQKTDKFLLERDPNFVAGQRLISSKSYGLDRLWKAYEKGGNVVVNY